MTQYVVAAVAFILAFASGVALVAGISLFFAWLLFHGLVFVFGAHYTLNLWQTWVALMILGFLSRVVFGGIGGRKAAGQFKQTT